MTRRLALVIVGVVITTLLLAGAGTLALASVRARATTVNELRAQATEIAANIDDLLDGDPAATSAEATRQLRSRLRVLNTLRSILPVDDISVLIAQFVDRRGPRPDGRKGERACASEQQGGDHDAHNHQRQSASHQL